MTFKRAAVENGGANTRDMSPKAEQEEDSISKSKLSKNSRQVTDASIYHTQSFFPNQIVVGATKYEADRIEEASRLDNQNAKSELSSPKTATYLAATGPDARQ